MQILSSLSVSHLFPNMSALVKISRIRPMQTADVERAFSQMKLMKTRSRNRMKKETLDSLLRIAVEGPEIDKYPFSKAVQLRSKKKKDAYFSINYAYFLITSLSCKNVSLKEIASKKPRPLKIVSGLSSQTPTISILARTLGSVRSSVNYG